MAQNLAHSSHCRGADDCVRSSRPRESAHACVTGRLEEVMVAKTVSCLRSFVRVLKKDASDTALGRFILLAIVLAVAGEFLITGYLALYQALDRAGWISHDHDTPVWIEGNWMSGEYRTCEMLTRTNPADSEASELPRLFCSSVDHSPTHLDLESAVQDFFENLPDADFAHAMQALTVHQKWSSLSSYFHVLPVRYNGRISREYLFVSWHCQRESSSLTCWALN